MLPYMQRERCIECTIDCTGMKFIPNIASYNKRILFQEISLDSTERKMYQLTGL